MNTTMFTLSKVLLVLSLSFFARIALPQSDATRSGAIEVAYNKTSSVVFSSSIKSVDRGSRDILAQKATGVENVLQLKAARRDFLETNLTVITAEGTIHQFQITYADEPDTLIIPIGTTPISSALFHSELTETDLDRYSSAISLTHPTIYSKRDERYGIILTLKGIYVKENVIFYRLRINNSSALNYNVEYLRFFIRDRQKVKRTASQELDMKPIYIAGNDKIIKGKTSSEIIFALDKFTIPDAKHLVIELYEHNGGRHLHLKVKNHHIVNAQPLP